MYRISNPDSQFAIQRGDYITITYDRNESANQFNLSYIDFEDPAVLGNAVFNEVVTMDFPLLSLAMAGELLMAGVGL